MPAFAFLPDPRKLDQLGSGTLAQASPSISDIAENVHNVAGSLGSVTAAKNRARVRDADLVIGAEAAAAARTAWLSPDVVVCDPARAGLSPAVVEYLRTCSARR